MVIEMKLFFGSYSVLLSSLNEHIVFHLKILTSKSFFFFMSSGLESTVPLSAQFLIAYNPFKVFGIESTVQCSYYQHT